MSTREDRFWELMGNTPKQEDPKSNTTQSNNGSTGSRADRFWALMGDTPSKRSGFDFNQGVGMYNTTIDSFGKWYDESMTGLSEMGRDNIDLTETNEMAAYYLRRAGALRQWANENKDKLGDNYQGIMDSLQQMTTATYWMDRGHKNQADTLLANFKTIDEYDQHMADKAQREEKAKEMDSFDMDAALWNQYNAWNELDAMRSAYNDLDEIKRYQMAGYGSVPEAEREALRSQHEQRLAEITEKYGVSSPYDLMDMIYQQEQQYKQMGTEIDEVSAYRDSNIGSSTPWEETPKKTAEDYRNELEQLNASIASMSNYIDVLDARYAELDAAIAMYSSSSDPEDISRLATAQNELNTLLTQRNNANQEYDSMMTQKWQLEHELKYDTLAENADYRSASNYKVAYVDSNLYRLINRNINPSLPLYRDGEEKQGDIQWVNANAEKYGKYENMTAEEIANYNYLYHTQGASAAYEYLQYLEPQMDARFTGNITNELAEMTQSGVGGAIAANALSVPLNLVGGIGYLDLVAQNVARDIRGDYAPINYNSAAMLPTHMSRTVRQTTAGMITDATGTIQLDPEKNPFWAKILNGRGLSDVYQLGMSMVDSRVAAMTGNGYVATGLLASSAATQGVLDALERGATDEQALQVGLWNGIAEAVFEFFEVENLLKGDPNWIRATMNQALTEGIGEGATTVANNISDFIIMTDKSQLMRDAAEYEKMGYDRKTAVWNAIADAAIDAGWDILGGAASGGISAAGMSAVQNATNTRNTGRYVQENQMEDPLMELANQMAGLGDYQGNVKKYAQKTTQRPNAYNVGRLYNETTRVIDQQNMDQLAEALQKQGMTKSEATKLASAIALDLNGIELTKAQERLLEKHEGSEAFTNAVVEVLGSDAYMNRNNALRKLHGEAPMTAQAAPRQTKTEEKTEVTQPKVETTHAVSEDGETHLVAEPEKTVSIQGIEEIKDGTMKLRMDDGTVVDAGELSFATPDEAMVYSALADMGMNVNAANLLASAFKTADISGEAYTLGIRQAYQLGQNNDRLALATGEYSSALTEHQRDVAFKMGKIFGGQQTAKAEATIRKARKNAPKNATEKTGKVHFDRNGRTFDDVRETALKTMEQLSAALGTEFYVFESYVNKNGQRVYKDENGIEVKAPNGWYDPATGAIHIDLNAGMSGKGTMLFTIAHELTHFMKDKSPAKYKVLANFLVEQYNRRGQTMDELVQAQIAKAKRNGRTMSPEVAFDEVVADSMEGILKSGNVIQMMADLKQQDKSIWQMIVDWFKNLAEDLKKLVNAYKDVKPDSVEGKMVEDMQDVIVILESLYADALIDAGENYKAVGAQKNTTQEGGVRMQARADGYDYSKPFSQQLDDYQNGLIPKGDTLLVGPTPDVLKNIGMTALPLTINTTHIDYALNGTKDFDHHLGKALMSQLPEAIKKPVAVMTSGTKAGSSIVMMLEIRHNGKQVIVPIMVDGFGRQNGSRIDSNAITSIYGKDYSISNSLYNAIVRENNKQFSLFYLDQNKATALLQGAKVLMPKMPATHDGGYIHSITEPGSPVKAKFSGQTETIQFKDWFGKSKIVNADGSPKVMYHGSQAQFSSFDKKKARSSGTYGKGFYFTDSTSHAGTYGNLYEVYLSIKNPVEHGKGSVTKDQVRKFLEAVAENEDYSIENYGTYDIDEILNGVMGGLSKADTFRVIQDISVTAIGDMVEAVELFNEVNGTTYDGIVAATETVAFDPTQIKSATDNVGTFDKKNTNIYYSERIDYTDAEYGSIVSQLQEVRTELREAEKERKALQSNGELLDAMFEMMMAEKRTPEYKAAKQKVKDLQEKLHAKEIEDRYYDLKEKEQALVKQEKEAYTSIANQKELKAIERSGLTEGEYFRKAAVKEYGYTASIADAGYLLPNGKFLNFSGEKGKSFGVRGLDHRNIGTIFEATSGTAAMIRFMNGGNIRVMAESPGLDIYAGIEPTKEQYASIKKMVREYAGKRFFVVDLSDENGRSVGNYTYEGNVNADRVVNDIKYFFENGKVRQQSSIAQFLSERDAGAERVAETLQKENGKLKEDVKYLKELLKLQRSVTNGTKFTRSSVEAAAGMLMKSVNARGDKAQLTELLNGFYEYIAAGEDLTWENVMEKAEPISDWLMRNQVEKHELDGFAQDVLRDIRGSRFYLDDQQKQNVAYKYGSYNEFRKKMMGTAVVSDKANMSLDSWWHDMAGQYPSIFDETISSSDMPEAFADAIDRLRSMEIDPYGYDFDREMMARDIMYQVYDSYWNVSTLKTVADVKQKQINELKSKHADRIEKIRAEHRESRARLQKQFRSELAAVKKDMRKTERENIQKAVERQRQIADRKRDNAQKAEMRRKIRKTIRDLDKLFSRGDKKKNVKEGMRDFAATALASAEVLFTDEGMSEHDMIRNGIRTPLHEWESKLVNRASDLLKKLESPDLEQLVEDIGDPDDIRTEAVMDVYLAEQQAKTRRELSGITKQLQDVFARERIAINNTLVTSLMEDLAKAYAGLNQSTDPYIKGAYRAEVYEMLHTMYIEGNVFGYTRVKDMTLEQLDHVYRAYKAVLTSVRKANELFAEGVKESVQLAADSVMIEESLASKNRAKTKLGRTVSKFMWNNLKPVYAFERIGSKTLSTLYGNIRKGQDTWAIDMREANEFRKSIQEKYGYDSWDMDKVYTFKTNSGADFNVTLEQLMSIYAYSKRAQAYDHMMKGGFVFDDNTTTKVTVLGVPVEVLNEDAHTYKVSMETLKEIIDTLNEESPDVAKFVDEMQDYLSTTMGEKGNSVSMKLYGIKLFNEKNYFPLKSSAVYSERAREANLQQEQGQVNLVNAGFAKSLAPNASTPIVLSGFMDVWSGHVNDMSMYHSFVLPMEDFRRVYNYSTPNDENGEKAGVIASIQNAHGTAATSYIDQLYKDLNGGALSDSREGLAKSLVGKFKKAAVMASLSVVFQQPSAIGRAFSEVDLKHFHGPAITKGTARAIFAPKRHDALWSELKKYAPVAMIKEMGYFDTGMGMSAQEYLQAKEYTGIKEKAKAFIKDSNYRDEVLSKGAAVADELTWIEIWKAVKNETAERNPDMKRDSEEFLKIAGNRFSEVIDKTQVYDSVLARSANMRSKSLYMNMATSFMAEPTTTMNMVWDALTKASKGQKKAAARAIASVAVSIIINAALSSIIYAIRDDDEDETLLEKYLSSFITDILDSFNPITYIPIIKDIWSIAQGFDVERADMSLVSDLVDKLKSVILLYTKDTDGMNEKQLKEWKRSLVAAWHDAAYVVFNMTGIPMRNVMREVEGLYNGVTTHIEDIRGRRTTWMTFGDVVGADVKSLIPFYGWLPGEKKEDRLYEALVSGNTAYLERQKQAYKDEDAYNSAVRKALRNNDPRVREAAAARFEGNFDRYRELFYEIKGEGVFDFDTIMGAINAEVNALEKAARGETVEEETTADRYDAIFNVENYYTAVLNGDKKMADAIYDELIADKKAEGYLLSEAEKAVASTFTSQVKREYMDGNISRSKAIELLEDNTGNDESKVKEWDFEIEHDFSWSARARGYRLGEISKEELIKAVMDIEGEDRAGAEAYIRFLDLEVANEDMDISASEAEAYFKYAEPSGISIDIWFRYKSMTAGIKNEKDPDTGKSIKHSSVRQIMAIIDSMDLTPEQKTALAESNGWAESTIEEYKLW